jgi:hypothetical protein
MKCIWEGDLLSVWDNVQLCRIIENLHYWIVRHFRPWISSCIDTWRVLGPHLGAFPTNYEGLDFDSPSEEDWSSDDENENSGHEESLYENEDNYDEDSSNANSSISSDEADESESDEVDPDADYRGESDDNSPSPPKVPITLPFRVKGQTKSPTPIIRYGRAGQARDEANSTPSGKSSPAQQRRRNAATLSPEMITRSRTPLGRAASPTSSGKKTTKHFRSLSTG